jgi:hypothetical protein
MSLYLLVLVLPGLFLLSCVPKASSGPVPEWMAPDAPRSDHDFFYGVGCAQRQITNRHFKRFTAEERARVDLAHNLYAYLITELEGDTTAVRAVIEAVLPHHEVIAFGKDGQGQLCARARLERRLVAEQALARREGGTVRE